MVEKFFKKKDIDIYSSEWCNLVFRGKNRSYGAYELRRSSSFRHGIALLLVIVAIIVATIPSVFENLANESVRKEMEEKEAEKIGKVIEVNLQEPKPEKRDEQKSKHRKYREKVAVSPAELRKPMMQMVEVRIERERGGGEKSDKREDKSDKQRMGELAESGFNSNLRDSRGTDMNKLNEEIERVKRGLAEGKQSYEMGMRELSEMGRGGGSGKAGGAKGSGADGNGKGNGGGGSNGGRKAEKSKGNVLVSYELDGRTDSYLHIPAYQCQFGGVVVVMIMVNKNGEVVSATIDKAASDRDECIGKMAVQSAMASYFSSSTSAPAKQKGTITYRFVSQ